MDNAQRRIKMLEAGIEKLDRRIARLFWWLMAAFALWAVVVVLWVMS